MKNVQVQQDDSIAQEISLRIEDINESVSHINMLNTNHIRNLSNQCHERLSFRISSNKNLEERLEIQVEFQQTMRKLLQKLTQAKISLMELNQANTIKQTQKTKQFINNFNESIPQYLKTLLLREGQLGSIVFIIDYPQNENIKQVYEANYHDLGTFMIDPALITQPINKPILIQAFNTEMQFLEEYTDMIILLKLHLKNKKYFESIEDLSRDFNRLKILNSKIATIAQIFPYASLLDSNDLFSCKRTSSRWTNLLDTSIMHKIYGDKQSITKSFVKLKQGLNLINATMNIMHKTKTQWNGTAKEIGKDLSNLAHSTKSILKCLVFKSHAHHEAQILISDPNDDLAKQIWNLPQQKLFKNFINSVLPSIKFSEQLYIPRLFKKFLSEKGSQVFPEIHINDLNLYRKQMKEKKQQKIQIRINSCFELKEYREEQERSNKFKSIIGSFVKPFHKKQSVVQESLIFHIHGGGFISMSSFIHQTYTRIWANNLKVPIVSVDYGKAPQFPFPAGLYDCFQAYMWTLYCFRQIYQIEPTKVILVGDSAGGNLVAALTNLLIDFKLRIPDGLVLVYPALNLNYNNYTPSLLTSLNDMILPHTFLKICLKAYLKQNADPFHPYVSPIYTNDEVLNRYPTTRIFVGNKDPFHDDCCRLTQRLNKKNAHKAKLIIFDQFPHGFLQFDMKTQPHQQCRKATKQVEKALAQLLGVKY